MNITFLGGVGEVTGSRYLVEKNSTRILVDCGLFQSLKSIKKNKFSFFTIKPKTIDAIVLTHAHIDHTGYLPVLVKHGFRGPIYCSKATFELCKIVLIDSAKIQEEDVRKINKHSKSRIKPLYTVKDVNRTLNFFNPVNYDTDTSFGDVTFKLICSGHILGAAFVQVHDGSTLLTFSGDLGRPQQMIMKTPPFIEKTDYLVLESTYGNRLHGTGDIVKELEKVIAEVVAKKGVLMIPAFAIGRTQMLLYALFLLKDKFPTVPVFLDSPMGQKVTDLYYDFAHEHRLSKATCRDAFNRVHDVRSTQESERLDRLKGPAIIIAGSGMAHGGRILDHFRYLITHDKATVLFVGYQAVGTLGRALIEGVQEITIYGKKYPVHAQIKSLDMLSAHADYNEILQWLSYIKQAPKKIFLTHGEQEAAESLQKKIHTRFGWNVIVPQYQDSFLLE